MYRVLSENGGLISIVKAAKDNPDGCKYDVLDGSGRFMRIVDLPKLLRETREAQKEWKAAGIIVK
jgi:hypothetical protein